MRARAALSLLLVAVAVHAAGCVQSGPDEAATQPASLSSLTVYEYRYAGDNVVARDQLYGWMALITNPTDEEQRLVVRYDKEQSFWGPIIDNEWYASAVRWDRTISANASELFLFTAAFAERLANITFHIDVEVRGRVTETRAVSREVEWIGDPLLINPGDHVQTATVGVWASNGTSFYTNIADLHTDSAFPKGYSDPLDDTPLPIYVYDEDRSEQPAGSQDTCHFTTISGYNGLLKSQAERSTGVRFLYPEEGYTVAGAEDHFLYGDALVFLNTIVAHDGPTVAADAAPNPQGDCFDPTNASPIPVPPVPPTSPQP